MTIATASALCTSSGNFCGAAQTVTATTIAGAISVLAALRTRVAAGRPRRSASKASSSAARTASTAISQSVPGTLPNCSIATESAP